jgi:predicted ATPase/class 3 adenylate cyclase
MPELPSGTVTFLFTDVEGSTRLLHELGAERYADALAGHRRVLREAFAAHGGVEVDTQGDAFFVAFPTAPGALAVAAGLTEALATGPIRVRVGLHTGTPLLTDEGYVGADVHRAARIAAPGHGGQVLVSASTAALLSPSNDQLQGSGLRDLGEHRLKDLSAAERIYQLGEREFPPLKSLYRTNLPVPATTFLGRDTELAEVATLLARDDVRLLTLTGPGGTGKTRLALQAVAAASDDYPDGVFWVPLAPLRDPSLVMEEARTAVGAQDGLADHIADKRLLLLLDNFEHLVEAAARLVELLASCPNLRLVVTSRELLQLPGEQAYPVPPLGEADGVALFAARARAVRPTFSPDETVTEICRRLDDLPLALELAAARVRALTPVQLLERLGGRLDLLTAGRGVDPRQQTLRATIEWSHDLLDDDEQRLYARISVFRGGCTLDAAEQICSADLDTIQALVDKSLLRYNEDRYWMLETIREHASEHLDASGEADELRRRHVYYFLALAEEAEPYVRSGAPERPKRWLDRLEAEHDNLRAALDRLETLQEGELCLRLAGAVAEFWGWNHLPEGRRYLESAIRLDDRPTRPRAKALNGAAQLARFAGDAQTARLHAEEALELYRGFANQRGTAESLLWLGAAVADEGDFSRAQQCFEDSARLFGESGDETYALFAARLLAWMHNELGDRERARALHESNLGRARALGDDAMVASTLGGLASYAVDEERVEDAVSLASESLRVSRDLGDHLLMVVELCRCAGALALKGQPIEATQLLAAAEALHEEFGMSMLPYLAEENDGILARIRGQITGAAFARAWEQGRALNVEDAAELALEALA